KRMRINARADLRIRPIASSERDIDQNFSGAGARFGHLGHDKLLRGTRLVDHNCLHMSLPFCSCLIISHRAGVAHATGGMADRQDVAVSAQARAVCSPNAQVETDCGMAPKLGTWPVAAP